MKNILIATILSFFALNVSSLQAQTLIPRDEVETIKEYDELLVEKYPSFFDKKIAVDVYEIDDTYSRIVYNDNGIHSEELVYQDGETKVIIAKLIKIAEEDVPQIVLDAYKKDDSTDAMAVAYYEVSHRYTEPISYAVEYSDDGKMKRSYYTALGRPDSRPK